MTGFLATDDSGRVTDPLTPGSLRPLLQEAATGVLIEGVADPASIRASATRAGAGRWRLELQSPTGEKLQGEVPNTDAAFDALRSWAADDGWWQEAFTWRPA